MKSYLNKLMVVTAICTCLFAAVFNTVYAQSAPDGSYRQSCYNVSVNGNTISAECGTMNGSWIRTSLRNFTNCNNEIWNNDGHLTCWPKDAPDGSYLLSCANILVTYDMSAECRTMNGNWVSAFLQNFTNCTNNEIWNNDGHLTCWPKGAPDGSYLSSCSEISVWGQNSTSGTNLDAKCRTMSGDWVNTHLMNFGSCNGDVSNQNGVLTCPKGSSSNSQMTPSQPAQYADLTITYQWISSLYSDAEIATPGSGVPFTYRISLANIGNKETGEFVIRFWLDNESDMYDASASSYSPNATGTAWLTLDNGLSQGDHTISVCLDANNQVPELNETNNCTYYGLIIR